MHPVFTPKRWEMTARARETGPRTTAELARGLKRDSRKLHAEVAAPSDSLAVQRTEDGQVHVPWSEIMMDMNLPNRLAA